VLRFSRYTCCDLESFLQQLNDKEKEDLRVRQRTMMITAR
jgi:hypothetical protein